MSMTLCLHLSPLRCLNIMHMRKIFIQSCMYSYVECVNRATLPSGGRRREGEREGEGEKERERGGEGEGERERERCFKRQDTHLRVSASCRTITPRGEQRVPFSPRPTSPPMHTNSRP